MTKIIGIKELQTKTKEIRKEVENGMHFIVAWRSKPIFEITPLQDNSFADDFRATDIYSEKFLSRMKKAEDDVRSGRVRRFKKSDDFLSQALEPQ